MKSYPIFILAAAFLFQSCMADLLPKSVKKYENQQELETKAKALLKESLKAQGYDAFNQHQTYEMTFTDHWKGPMAGMGKLWAQKTTKMTERCIPNTFDSSIEFLDGKEKDLVIGLQSWNYYQKENQKSEANFDVKSNKRHVFGIAAFQYFAELGQRLMNAEILRYGGEKKMFDKNYDLIYATWKSIEKQKDLDQYILYINKETKLIDYASYTLRDNYLKAPGSQAFYGTIHFTDMRDIDGFKVPFKQVVFLMNAKKSNEKYIHQLTLDSFKFDTFEKEVLQPNKKIKNIGDSK